MPMTPNERKVALRDRNVSQATIARTVERSGAFVSDVINGYRRSDVVEATVADAIGRPLEEVFEPLPPAWTPRRVIPAEENSKAAAG